eukprot:scaffold11448_cov44-Attheya_sp.AAC.1
MVLRQILSRAIFPTLEKDLSRTIHKEVSAMEDVLMMAPQVFSYQGQAGATGAFGRTGQRLSSNQRLVRVEQPIRQVGLFQE